MTAGRTAESLVRRLHGGERQAIVEIYELSADRVHDLARVLVRPGPPADAVYSRTFERLVVTLPGLDDPDDFRVHLYRTALACCRDAVRAPDPLREVLVLHHRHRLPLGEIGRCLGHDLDTTREMVHRIRRRMVSRPVDTAMAPNGGFDPVPVMLWCDVLATLTGRTVPVDGATHRTDSLGHLLHREDRPLLR